MSLSVLITGVAGFLGSHLSEALLEAGYTVTGIDNFDPFYSEKIKERNIGKAMDFRNFKLIRADITDKESLNSIKGKWDVVIHIAARAGVLPSIQNPAEYVTVNITGTLNVLEFIRERTITKYIFASSSSIYGNSTEVPFSEDQKVDGPISPYAFTKRSCELMNYTYHHLYKISCLNLRLFTLYGPRQRPDLSIHKFTRLIEKGLPVEMYGDGNTARDYTHVKDVVKGFTGAIDFLNRNENVFEIINIGNSSPVKLKDLIYNLYEAAGAQPEIRQMPAQPGDVEVTFSDISKASSLLGYKPEVTFREGLSEFVQWYRENSDYLQ